jgi:5-deoxy-D-glucuronate isomerase
MRINLFQLDQGEDARADVATVDVIVVAVLVAMRAEHESADFRKLLAAKSVIEQFFARGGAWRKEDTITLDNALGIALDRWPKFTPVQANIAIKIAMGEKHA